VFALNSRYSANRQKRNNFGTQFKAIGNGANLQYGQKIKILKINFFSKKNTQLFFNQNKSSIFAVRFSKQKKSNIFINKLKTYPK